MMFGAKDMVAKVQKEAESKVKEKPKMKTSDNGVKFFEEVEGVKLKPYPDSRGIPTIGIGSTMYEDGRKVTLSDPPITEERAYELFHNTLKTYEKGVNDVVTTQLNQNQYDALVSFTYNEGVHAFQNSTMLKLVNARDFQGVANEFSKWEKAGADLHILHGRREKEKTLFLKPE